MDNHGAIIQTFFISYSNTIIFINPENPTLISFTITIQNTFKISEKVVN